MSKFAGALKGSLTRQGASVRDTWERLGRIDLASTPVIMTIVIAHLLTVFGFELGRIGKEPFLVLAIALMAEVLFWASYLTLYALQVWLRSPWSSVLSKIITIVASHVVRILALEFAFLQFQLTEVLGISNRLLGDLTGVVILLIGIAYIQVVLRELGAQEYALSRAKEDLAEQGRVSKVSAETADQMLRAKARQSLGAQLEALTKYLRSAKTPRATRISSEIADLIESKVRPLSADLWNQLAEFDKAESANPSTPKTRFPRLIFPASDFRAGMTFVLAGLNIFFTAPGLADWGLALQFGLVMLSYPVLGALLTLVYPSASKLSLVPGITVVALLSLLAWSPSLIFLLLQTQVFPGLRVLSFTSTMVILSSSLVVAIWSAFKRERIAYLEEIKALNREKSRRLALIDQAVWVARRNWSYLVHGTVQGALTVALSRLKLSGKVTPELTAQVLSDIERAKNALEENQDFGQQWNRVLPQIKETWDGVCQIRHEISADAEQVLERQTAASTCVAEIVKELVSNGFRHGKASLITIQISLDEIGDIQVISTNNGLSVSPSREQGIGSEMFDELTSSWGFRNTPNGPRFRAVVPVLANP